MCVLGWDIGGAHLKRAVVEDGQLTEVRQIACPLWQGTDQLRTAFRAMPPSAARPAVHAVTMTGELVDRFANRSDGVRVILDVLAEFTANEVVRIYSISGDFIDTAQAYATPHDVASANWHATAQFVSRSIPDAILLDIGSTTTDIVPIQGAAIMARGASDAARLATGELVYTGVVRTPLCALADRITFRSKQVGVMAEWFATTADIYRISGQLPDDADLHPTADGRGKTIGESRARLARMIGYDEEMAPEPAWRELAATFARRQVNKIEAGCEQVLSAVPLPPDAPVIAAGIGGFLAREIALRLHRPHNSFGCLLDAPEGVATLAAAHAPAAAVALLCNNLMPRSSPA